MMCPDLWAELSLPAVSTGSQSQSVARGGIGQVTFLHRARPPKCNFSYNLKVGMATHSSILAWRIPWIEENGGLQSMRLHRVRHD